MKTMITRNNVPRHNGTMRCLLGRNRPREYQVITPRHGLLLRSSERKCVEAGGSMRKTWKMSGSGGRCREVGGRQGRGRKGCRRSGRGLEGRGKVRKRQEGTGSNRMLHLPALCMVQNISILTCLGQLWFIRGWARTLSAGVKFDALETVLGFASSGFEISLNRRIIQFLGRACLCIGMIKVCISTASASTFLCPTSSNQNQSDSEKTPNFHLESDWFWAVLSRFQVDFKWKLGAWIPIGSKWISIRILD